jgi:putative ABC transport system permease protein
MVILLAAITMSMSARERVTEIAVLKAIGFGQRLVLTLMLTEFVLLTVVGGVIGVVLGKVVYASVDMGKQTGGMLVNFTLYPIPAVVCIAASLVVGLLAGGFPARNATRLSVVDGLRRVV